MEGNESHGGCFVVANSSAAGERGAVISCWLLQDRPGSSQTCCLPPPLSAARYNKLASSLSLDIDNGVGVSVQLPMYARLDCMCV